MRNGRRDFTAAVVAALALALGVGLSAGVDAARNGEASGSAPLDSKQAKLAYQRRITDAKYRYKDAVLKAKQVYARNHDSAAYERSIAVAKKRFRVDVHKAKEELHRNLAASEGAKRAPR